MKSGEVAVNPAELRFRITRWLGRESGVREVKLTSPVPGKPLSFVVATSDPFTLGVAPKKALRWYRVTIEEIDDTEID
jgi:hypothetical protein